MLIWIALAVALLILIVLAWRFLGNCPIAYRGLKLVDTKRFLEGFLLQLEVGSVLDLERESGPGFLQLALIDRRSGVEELEFGLLDAEWSRDRFDLVYNALRAAGHNCRLETASGNQEIPRFLRVQIRGKREELIQKAIQVLILAADQLGFDPQDRYALRMKGAISTEYQLSLADQMEQIPRANFIPRAIGGWLRRAATKKRRE